jgi:hypothetical protein
MNWWKGEEFLPCPFLLISDNLRREAIHFIRKVKGPSAPKWEDREDAETFLKGRTY